MFSTKKFWCHSPLYASSYITFIHDTLMYASIKVWIQDLMEAHQGFNDQTTSKPY